MRQPRRWLAVAVVGFLAGWAGLGSLSAQDVLEKKSGVPKLISQVDLDCSFFVMTEAPKIRITGPVQAREFLLLSESTLFYVDSLPGAPAITDGSLWTILEWGPRVRGTNPPAVLGNVVYRRGRAKVVRFDAGRAVLKVDKSCGVIEAGCFLVPYETGDIMTGTEMPYEIAFREANAPTGRVVYMENETMQISARGFWVLIDIGADQALTVGEQLSVYRPEEKKLPRPIANAVVIRTGGRWAILKILNSRDTVLKGDLAQARLVE
ncbi:MAG: hypothetical protein ACYDH3_04625 [Candidatus Aminicenantales bacterium]